MDYSRNYFCFAVFVLFVITTVCSGASLLNMQDVANADQQETEIVDKTEALMSSSVKTEKVSSTVSSKRTENGDIIITTPAEAIGGQTNSAEETPDHPASSLSEDQETESSTTSENKPELPSTTLEISDETAGNMETTSDDGSTQEAHSPNTTKPNTGKPDTKPSGIPHNGASPVVLSNAFGLFLIAVVSRVLLKT